MHRHNVSKADSKVLAHHLVHADLGFIDSIVSKNDADCVLALLSLQMKFSNHLSDTGTGIHGKNLGRQKKIMDYKFCFDHLIISNAHAIDLDHTLSSTVSPLKS